MGSLVRAGRNARCPACRIAIDRNRSRCRTPLTEQLAYAAAAAELRQLGADDVADAFIETRLGGQWRSTYGMLDARHNAERILDQLYPAS